jgi:hypothetical protein
MPASIVFDVYGQLMLVERDSVGWCLFHVGTDGKRSLAEVMIPEFILEHELGQIAGARQPMVGARDIPALDTLVACRET